MKGILIFFVFFGAGIGLPCALPQNIFPLSHFTFSLKDPQNRAILVLKNLPNKESKKKLLIQGLKMGDFKVEGTVYVDKDFVYLPYVGSAQLGVEGKLSLKEPWVDLKFSFRGVRLDKLLEIFSFNSRELKKIKVPFYGVLHLKGYLSSPYIKLESICDKGYFFGLSVVGGAINLKGCYPFLEFSDSYIRNSSQNNIYIQGVMNLKNIDQYLNTVYFHLQHPQIGNVKFGVDAGSHSVYLQDENENISLFFNREEDSPYTDLLYKIKGNNYLKVRFRGQNDSLLGVEKRLNF